MSEDRIVAIKRAEKILEGIRKKLRSEEGGNIDKIMLAFSERFRKEGITPPPIDQVEAPESGRAVMTNRKYIIFNAGGEYIVGENTHKKRFGEDTKDAVEKISSAIALDTEEALDDRYRELFDYIVDNGLLSYKPFSSEFFGNRAVGIIKGNDAIKKSFKDTFGESPTKKAYKEIGFERMRAFLDDTHSANFFTPFVEGGGYSYEIGYQLRLGKDAPQLYDVEDAVKEYRWFKTLQHVEELMMTPIKAAEGNHINVGEVARASRLYQEVSFAIDEVEKAIQGIQKERIFYNKSFKGNVLSNKMVQFSCDSKKCASAKERLAKVSVDNNALLRADDAPGLKVEISRSVKLLGIKGDFGSAKVLIQQMEDIQKRAVKKAHANEEKPKSDNFVHL